LLGVVVAALADTGCLSESITTRIEVKDTRDVSLHTSGGVLGPSDAEAKLADGAITPEPGAMTRYALHAVRDPSGAIAFEWKLGAPLLNGEHQTVLEAAGVLTEETPASRAPIVTAEALAAPTLRIGSCATLREVAAKGVFVGYRASEDRALCEIDTPRSARGATVPYELETPWSNVRELRQTVEPQKGFAIGCMAAATALFGGLGGLVLGFASPKNGWGWALVSTAVVIDLAWIPTLVASPRDTFAYPPERSGERDSQARRLTP
jgi:hypothetical protein